MSQALTVPAQTLPAGIPATEEGIRTYYGGLEVQTRDTFALALNDKLKAKHVAVAAGGVVALAVTGGVIVLALQAAVAAGALAIVGGGIAAGGIVAYKKFPRWIQSLDNREKERSLAEQNRHVQALQAEANRHIQALKAEARKNPVESLQNYLLGKQNRLKAFKGAVAQIGAQVRSMADMLGQRKKEKPNKDYSSQERDLATMHAAHQKLLSTAVAGDAALVKLHEIIDDEKFNWKFAQVGRSAAEGLRNMTGEELLEGMLADESFDAIRNEFNSVFSEIEVEIGNINSNNLLTFGDGVTIDVSSINIPEAVSVS